MKNYRTRGRLKHHKLIGMVIVFLLIIPVTTAWAESGAKNSPPQEIGIMGAFDPNHDYLDNGFAIINDLGGGEVEIVGSTSAKQYVDRLGVKIYLQKWTGSSWINLYNDAPSWIDTEARVMEATEYKTVEEGYYYRIRSEHWAEEGNVREEGIKYSDYILIN